MASSLKRTLFTMLCGAMAAFLVFSLAGVREAGAAHEPANKGAAAGSDIDRITDDEPILSETMKVSSPEDVIIAVTAECSILTQLATNNNNPSSTSYGSVRLWVTIDGKRVPVSTDDAAVDPEENPPPGVTDPDASDASDIGEITFCNRTYHRTVEDRENDMDGVDAERDYIRTRTANAFNWLALDTGVNYDDVALNGNNILTVQLWADFDEAVAGHPLNMADAFVGSRTMIIEPIRLSIHEQVNEDDAGGF